MDSFETTIEQYKRELLKYAKKNGAVYAGSDNGFVPAKAAEPSPEATPVSRPYNSAYVKNRPMPVEYDGSEDVSEVVATVPAQQEPAVAAVTDALTGETPAERKYANYDEFLADNPRTGKLRVQTFAGRRAFPVSNAKVSVEKEFLEGVYSFSEMYTDIDGVAENITLPTKDKSLSLTPGSPIPYATYTVRVEHPQFTPQVFYSVPIFDSIESLQPVPLTPTNGRTDDSEVVSERGPDL